MLRKGRKDTLLKKIINNWPLRKYIGVYAFMPLFFIIGGLIEYSMINLNVGNANFYKVYSRNTAQQLAQQQIELDQLIEIQKQKLIEELDKKNSTQKKPK